jgi:hypothetical protein
MFRETRNWVMKSNWRKIKKRWISSANMKLQNCSCNKWEECFLPRKIMILHKSWGCLCCSLFICTSWYNIYISKTNKYLHTQWKTKLLPQRWSRLKTYILMFILRNFSFQYFPYFLSLYLYWMHESKYIVNKTFSQVIQQATK